MALGVSAFIPTLAGLSFLMAATIIAKAFLLSKVIDLLVFGGETPPLLWWYYLGSLVFLRFLMIWLRERIARRHAVKIKSGLRGSAFAHLLSGGHMAARRHKTGTLVNTLTEGVEKLDDYFTKYIPSLIHILILPLTIIIFTIAYDWISGLILALTAPLILFFMFLIGTHAKRITERQWKEHGNLSARFLDTLQGLKTLKLFGAGSREQEVVAIESDRYRVMTIGVLKIAFLSGFVLELAASVSIALVAVQVGIRLIEGLMVYQAGLFILLLAPEFYLPFRLLGAHHHTGMEGAAAAESLFDVKDTPHTVASGSRKELPVEHFSITFSGVHYIYPDTAVEALSGVNLHLRSGELTALVGPSGGGKTTLAALLMGFLQPTRGNISIGEIPLHEVEHHHWLSRIAWVPQHPHFFNASLLDNLLMAKPEATREQVEEAARMAGAHPFIQHLPHGYDTVLFDNAATLSGGEKQRLAITRAFLKDAPVLILDEPTANLDPESEHHIAQATQALISNRTTLIIAHRLRTVQMAHQIVVMDQGIIAERGTHQTLMGKQGIYARFIQTGLNHQSGRVS